LTAVLLLHGQPGGIRDWDRVVAALGADVHAIAEYRPGWDGVNPPLDLRGNAQAAVAKLDRYGIDRAVIVGHSLGAGVAAWIAVLHPERVRALVLTSPGANTLALGWFDRVLASTVVGPALSALLLAGVGGALASSSVRHVLDRRLGLSQPFMRAGSRMLLRPGAWRSFVVEQRALFRDLPALETRLGEISAPTTVVSGTADRVVPTRAARLLAEQIPGAELELIAGAGHLLPHQHGDAIAAIVGRYTTL
jgi:pimeloyl-ACP methyl ester carboxylesterase